MSENIDMKPPIPTKSERQAGGAGKGDARRPSAKPASIMNLRHQLAFGNQEEKAEAKLKLIELGDL